jgi:hypothetical protein
MRATRTDTCEVSPPGYDEESPHEADARHATV